MFALVDCNSFYASCEVVFNPKLRNKPVVVLSNNDGCVIARSKEAKQIGIKMGEPIFKIKEFVRRNDVKVYSANFALYGDISRRVMNVLRGFSPNIEIYSIDEAFLCVKGIKDLTAYGTEIRARIRQWTGVTVGVGIAPTKTLAKIANRLAKNCEKLSGVCVLNTPELIETALSQTPIQDVWGVGRQYARFLEKHGVTDAAQFCALSPAFVRQNLTVVGARMQSELQGVSCISLEETFQSKKSILTSRSFGAEISEYYHLRQAVATFAAACAEKLRRQKTAAGCIRVFIETNGHKPETTQYFGSQEITLASASNLTNEITKNAIIALDNIFRKGLRYKRAGVLVSEIIPETKAQTDLFAPCNRPKFIKANAAIDELNAKYGRGTVRFGAESIPNRSKWKMNQNNLSQKFTTSWNELLLVKL